MLFSATWPVARRLHRGHVGLHHPVERGVLQDQILGQHLQPQHRLDAHADLVAHLLPGEILRALKSVVEQQKRNVRICQHAPGQRFGLDRRARRQDSLNGGLAAMKSGEFLDAPAVKDRVRHMFVAHGFVAALGEEALELQRVERPPRTEERVTMVIDDGDSR